MENDTERKNAWIKYNSVDFGSVDLKLVKVKVASKTGGRVELWIDNKDGPVIAKIEIPKNKNWSVVNSALGKIPSGTHNLIAVLYEGKKLKSIGYALNNKSPVL